MQIRELEELLKSEIPIAAHLGIRELSLSENVLALTLPLNPNVNHKGTMFGGSLYSASALACYALFLTGLREGSVHTNNIVISEGDMQYLAPVEKDATVQARWNSAADKDKFFKNLKNKQKARVLLRAEVLVDGKICAEFSGSFVAHL